MSKPVVGAPRPHPTFIRDRFFSLNPGIQQFILLGNQLDLQLHYHRKRSFLHTAPDCVHCDYSRIEWRRFLSVLKVLPAGRMQRGVLALTSLIVEQIGGDTPRGMVIEISRANKADVAQGALIEVREDIRTPAGDVALLVATRYKVPVVDLVQE